MTASYSSLLLQGHLMTQLMIRNRYRRHVELSSLQLPTTVVFTTVVEDEQGQEQGHTPCLSLSTLAIAVLTKRLRRN